MASPHDATRVVRTASFEVAAPKETVFPLFGPDREREWAWGWRPEPVDPQQIKAEEGAVFKTSHRGDRAVWVVSRYDPQAGTVEYVTFRHEDRLGVIWIEVSPTASGGSRVEVTYSFTALSERGVRHIAHFTEEYYRNMMDRWQKAITHFLKTGEVLKSP